MIHSVEMEASAALEASKLMSESLADSITIGDMHIDDKGNIQYKDSGGNWTTVISSLPTNAIKDTVSPYIDLNGLREYDKKIKEYIDNRIDEKLANITKIKYKVISGED